MQNQNFKNFFISFSLYSFVIYLLSFAIYTWFPQLHLNKWYLFILIFLYIIALLSFYFLSKSLKGKLSSFANVYMILNFLRLVIFTLIIFIYAYYNKTDAASFTLTFFSYYVLITVWEVVALKKIN